MQTSTPSRGDFHCRCLVALVCRNAIGACLRTLPSTRQLRDRLSVDVEADVAVTHPKPQRRAGPAFDPGSAHCANNARTALPGDRSFQ